MRFFVFALFAFVALATNYDQIIETVNNAHSTWKAGRVENVEKLTKLLGVVQGEGSPKKISYSHLNANIPESFDPREQWPECPSLKEVRDQSVCGSCWAFGAAEAATDRLCIASKGKIQDRLSSEDLLSCCSSCGFGCEGGFPYAAWNWFNKTGVTTGGEYGTTNWCNAYAFAKCDHHCTGKYEPCGETQDTPACVQECQEGYPIEYKKDKHFFQAPYQPSSVEDIQIDLMTNGPQEVAFTVYEDFMTYKTGVYQHLTGSRLGGHAVKLLGWGVENDTPYWLIANSWNEDWGNEGYFKILRGSNECGIEGQNIAALPSL
ncbi:hypothetical protein WA158_001904 [Blastocystis sp. Blastoise]